jgi:hypothetical protein
MLSARKSCAAPMFFVGPAVHAAYAPPATLRHPASLRSRQYFRVRAFVAVRLAHGSAAVQPAPLAAQRRCGNNAKRPLGRPRQG